MKIESKALIRVSDVRRQERWFRATFRSLGRVPLRQGPIVSPGPVASFNSGEYPVVPFNRILNLVEAVRKNSGDEKAGKYLPLALDIIERGHAGQFRKSGEPYIVHPLKVAGIVAEWGMGEVEVLGALCHDLIEDGFIEGKRVTADFIRQKFGERVSRLVEGVTELGKEPEYEKIMKPSLAEKMGKWVEYGAKDLAIILIKLADRLHNMRTLAYMDPEKRRGKALETLHIFGKVADILGIWELKREIEELSFPHVKKEDGFQYDHQEIKAGKDASISRSGNKMESAVEDIRSRLNYLNRRIEILAESRGIYELYQRMQRRDLPLKDLSPADVWRINIVVPSESDCYVILGEVHKLYAPVKGEMHDFIADPPPNGHRFLHTYVYIPGFGRMLVQIRDRKMQEAYKFGILARIRENRLWHKKAGPWLHALKESLMEEGVTEGRLFDSIEAISSPISVLTRKGEKVELPFGSTALDFAYREHPDFFVNVEAAMVNGRYVGLSHALQDGDEVKIMVGEKARPTVEWMDWVKRTPAAHNLLAKYLNKQDNRYIYESALAYLDKKTLEYALPARALLKTNFIETLIAELGLKDEEELLYQIGTGKVRAEDLVQEARKRYLQEVSNPAAEKRFIGIEVITEDRPGLLKELTDEFKKQGMNLDRGFFHTFVRDDRRWGMITLALQVVTGAIGGLQILQVQHIGANLKGGIDFRFLSNEEVAMMRTVIEAPAKPKKK